MKRFVIALVATIAVLLPAGSLVQAASCNGASHQPRLSNGSANPGSGTLGTTITFSVVYADTAGCVPTLVTVTVSGVGTHALTTSGTNFTAGVTYVITLAIPAGSHTYSFSATSGTGGGGKSVTLTAVQPGAVVITNPTPGPDSGSATPATSPTAAGSRAARRPATSTAAHGAGHRVAELEPQREPELQPDDDAHGRRSVADRARPDGRRPARREGRRPATGREALSVIPLRRIRAACARYRVGLPLGHGRRPHPLRVPRSTAEGFGAGDAQRRHGGLCRTRGVINGRPPGDSAPADAGAHPAGGPLPARRGGATGARGRRGRPASVAPAQRSLRTPDAQPESAQRQGRLTPARCTIGLSGPEHARRGR